MYLFGLYRNLRVEAGLWKGIFALHFTFFALRLVLANNGSIVADGRLEVVVGKRRVAVFEGVLEGGQISEITTRIQQFKWIILNVLQSHDWDSNQNNHTAHEKETMFIVWWSEVSVIVIWQTRSTIFPCSGYNNKNVNC